MDDSLFYVTAIFIPILFVLAGALVRFTIKRVLEWELVYFGIELVLAAFASALIHLFNPPTKDAAVPNSASVLHHIVSKSLLTRSQNANIMATLISAPSQWEYSGRCGFAIAMLLMALFLLVALHILFEVQAKPLPKYKKGMEIFFLFIVADLLGGGAMVYMERLLR